MDAQRASFRRYGVWADWEEPYLTLQPAYEAAQLRVFAAMFEARRGVGPNLATAGPRDRARRFCDPRRASRDVPSALERDP